MFSGAIIVKCGVRMTVILGSVIICAGYVASSFVTDFPLLFLTYGTVVGNNCDLAHTVTVTYTVCIFFI